MIRNIATCVGIVVLIVSVIMDRAGRNSSLVELVGCIVLIVSASSLVKREAATIDYVVCAVGGALMLWMSFMLDNGSMVELCAGVVLIIVTVNYFRSFNQSNKK